MPDAQIVMNIQTGHRRREPTARLDHTEKHGHGVAQRLRPMVFAAKNDRRHRVSQHTGANRMALGVVGIQEAFRRRPLHHLSQLPSQVHRILHASLKALAAVGGMHMRGVARNQHASLTIGSRLPRSIR